MIHPLGTLAARMSHGGCDAADPSRGPLAFGAGGGPPAPRGGAHRYLLPSASCPCSLVWPWRGGPAPGDSRWASCPLEGGGTSGGAWDVTPAPARPHTRLAPC